MNDIFIIQIIVSFIAGGITIAFLTFLAERVSDKISGIVLAFPSTAVMGYFFLSWATTPEEVAGIVPATFIPLGATALYPLFYVYTALILSRTKTPKLFQILLTAFLGFIFWLSISFPAAFFKITNFYIGTLIYLIIVFGAHILLNKNKIDKPEMPKYTTTQKISRPVFVGLIIAIIVFLGKIFNPFWGGMFAMAPAAFSSSLMVLHWYYGPDQLFPMVSKIAIGTLSIYIYSISVAIFFPITGFIYGTLIALVISLITSFLISKLQFIRFHLPNNNQK